MKSEKISSDDSKHALLPVHDINNDENDEENLFNPAEFRDHQHATTELDTLLHLVKATISSGFMNLPAAVGHAGVLAGPIGLVLIAVLMVHCEHMLVISSKAWCRRRGKSKMSFADVGEECFKKRYSNKGWIGRLLVNSSLLCAQFGFCCVYMLFVSRNLQQVFANNCNFNVDVRLWILFLLPIYILFSLIKNLTTLAWLSFVANLLMITGVICMLVHIFGSLHNPLGLPSIASAHGIPLFVASSIYAFESIGLILPLENEMKHPDKFPTLLNLGMVFVTFLYIFVGFFGYLSCTENCHGSITLNLGETPLSLIVRLTISISIFLSYFLQSYVIFSLIESWVISHANEKYELLKRHIVRANIVIITAFLASTIPHLEYIISLFGATANTTLCITLPAIIHTISIEELSKLSLLKNIGLILFGISINIIGVTILIQKYIILTVNLKTFSNKAK